MMWLKQPIPDEFGPSPEEVDAMYDTLAASHQEAVYEIERLTTELARWHRHGVLVTEDCQCTEAYMLGAEEDGFPPTGQMVPDPACPKCKGSGKVLKDGAERVSSGFAARVVFPASWLEGASDD